MTLNELNNILLQVAECHSRDKILEFSFALLNWMGISSFTDGKPQLLSPQTVKLKEILANAPQTVQPQLYRLSADNQNIRVRFAVFKKIKKENLSLLVDNDPGLTSYQSIMKGIAVSNNGSVFVPSQQYFIHFITTNEYDKLMLVFNQGDQKRIITFKSRLTNTQYNRIIQIWQNIGTKSKPEIADLLWKSLDIKEVNKEFYASIKERFDALVGIVKQRVKKYDETEIKQFAIRLIGRYIFCWFLKEKEIIPNQLLSSEIVKYNNHFHQTYLQKLFFGTLNSRINERKWLFDEDAKNRNLFEKIPYMNGGLFDKTKEDDIFANLEINDWLINFIEVLENYDFTVDESSLQYQQLAVDPEMLGRIFENLMASQSPDTEEAANNKRKAYGAFYTPRDIVDYMVEESLKTFLANKLNINSDELNPAFSSLPVWPEKLNKYKKAAENALINIKILDPACGSGAFPIGVLHKLIQLRQLLNLYANTYQLKKDILSQNIYGVDIMPMAVEIARLRAWLSLIVEEDYKGEKISSNFGIDALPNLEFKFMQGNSLLDTFEGIKILNEKLLQYNSNNIEHDIRKNTNDKIRLLQTKYFALRNAGKLHTIEAKTVEKQLLENKILLDKLSKSKVHEPAASYSIFGNKDNSINIAEKLEELQKEYFSTSDKERKKELKSEIETHEWNLIITSLNEAGKTNKIKDLVKLKDQNVKPYFLYKLNFPEVFSENGGFDIVIGNPPYVRQESIDSYFKPKYIENHPEVGGGTADLYVYFFDSALSVVNNNGIIIFITLNKFLKTQYGIGLRNKLKEINVDMIIDFFELPVFEASTDTAITKIINQPDKNSTRYYPVKSLDNLDLNIIIKGNYLKVIKDEREWKFIDLEQEIILKKYFENSISLKDFTENKIYSGIKTGLNSAFIISNQEKNKLIKLDPNSDQILKKFANSTSINKYNVITDSNKCWFINSHNGILIKITDYLAGKKHFGSKLYYNHLGQDILVINTEENGNKVRINRVLVKQNFPNVYKHLKKFESDLKIRGDQGEDWTNLRNCDYVYQMYLPKIIYIHTAKYHKFYLDEEGMIINNSCYMIISDCKYLFFYLNSYLFDWFKRIKFVAYGDADEDGRVKLDYNKMITVPIKQINEQQLDWFEKQYDKIKKVLGNEAKVLKYEQEVEVKLFKIYNLTYKDVIIICPDFWLNEITYNNTL